MMSRLSQAARVAISLTPKKFQSVAKFLYRLPVYYAEERSFQRAEEAGLGVAVLCPAEGIQIFLPSDRIAHAVMMRFFFERDSTAEWRTFLALAEGCRSFVDIGASGGCFSSLFAASRPDGEILSIEPDPPSREVLNDVRALNLRPEANRWLIDARGVGSTPEEVAFLSNGYGAEVLNDGGNEATRAFAVFNRREATNVMVQVDTLENICRTHDFKPDIIKVDIESYEYEMIESSQSFLDRFAPRIHLELHLLALQDRGLDPQRPLRILQGLGYRSFRQPPGRSLVDELGAATGQLVLRLDLVRT